MNIKLPSSDSIIDKIAIGFFAFFGWQLAVWVNGFIPWPS